MFIGSIVEILKTEQTGKVLDIRPNGWVYVSGESWGGFFPQGEVRELPIEVDKDGVPRHGGIAMRQGWDIKSNPFRKARRAQLLISEPRRMVWEKEWNAQWWTEEAAAFRSHVFGTKQNPSGKDNT